MSQKTKSVSEKMAELGELVAWFESDEFVIENAMEKFKQAEELAISIENDLKNIKNDINIIKKRFDEE